MADSSYSMFNAMADIIAAPGKALDEIKSHTSWLWWPLLITMLLASGLMTYYYSWVDFPWLIEETIRQVPAENRAESADVIRNFMSVGTSTWTTVAAIVVMSLVIYTVQATYLHLANKLATGAEIGFGQWFSFSVWTSFVGVFGALAAFVVIFMADSNQLAGEKAEFAIRSCESRRSVVYVGQYAVADQFLDAFPDEYRLRPLDGCHDGEINRHCGTTLGVGIWYLGPDGLTRLTDEEDPDFRRTGSATDRSTIDFEVHRRY